MQSWKGQSILIKMIIYDCMAGKIKWFNLQNNENWLKIETLLNKMQSVKIERYVNLNLKTF